MYLGSTGLYIYVCLGSIGPYIYACLGSKGQYIYPCLGSTGLSIYEYRPIDLVLFNALRIAVFQLLISTAELVLRVRFAYTGWYGKFYHWHIIFRRIRNQTKLFPIRSLQCSAYPQKCCHLATRPFEHLAICRLSKLYTRKHRLTLKSNMRLNYYYYYYYYYYYIWYD